MLVPVIALICNIVVVSGNSLRYVKAGFYRRDLLLPFALASVPMSFIGGNLVIGKLLFEQILFWVLLISGVRLLIHSKSYDESTKKHQIIKPLFAMLIGGALGFLSGITGIGGGIYLAPILYNLRAGSPKQIACTSSLFILLNSLAGLLGQIQKNALGWGIEAYWYLPVMVLIGGQMGNLMLLKCMSSRAAALLTGLLVLFVAAQLGVRMWG